MRSRSALALVCAAGLAFAACGDDPDDSAADVIEGVVVEDGQSRDHVENPVYDADPPSGGDHAPIWLNCGVYDVEVPNEFAVHALEHGVVWFAHDPDLSTDERNTLIALHDAEPQRVIVSPYEGLEATVVAVAWERRLAVDSVEDPRLVEFLDAYISGAQSPEPRAPCSGGVGADGAG